ncbi:hypothetical protein LZD49_16730 [Dyadobacter sp. CY261]|uniref:hypothetical protein n=1 Tax=Dyadobacter sp. CY261 TaxID=2907203 RepID=UPI001F450D03|nr:hypothetical protein [Dyadobacter sp. CY261]MCF0072128.1 hypothetical protein [Dyadobacter sp. CY261]
MAKIRVVLFFVIAVCACRQSEQNASSKDVSDLKLDNYNLIFVSPLGGITYNFVSDSVIAKFRESTIYADTLGMSMENLDSIAQLFYANKVNEVRGDVYLDGENVITPQIDTRIIVCNKKDTISNIYTSQYLRSENELDDKRERRLFDFQKAAFTLLKKQSKYKALEDSLAQMNRQNNTTIL